MTSGGLDISTESHGATARVAAHGEIDIATAGRLAEAVERAIAPGGAVELDLRGVRFMDSAGIAAITRCRRHAAHAGASLTLCCHAGGPVAQLLEWTGLLRILDVRMEDPSTG